jgi:predicted metalloprotease with PDZ domain
VKGIRQGAIAWVAVAILIQAIPAKSQSIRQPEPAPLPAPLPRPEDRPYVGAITIDVDATDVQRRIVKVHEVIPVQGREVTLLYPEWIPGEHAPSGPIEDFAGLITTVDGKRVNWMRDKVNVYAFHVPLPQGAKTLDVEFQYLAPERKDEGRIAISNRIADLKWNTMVLYPAGYFSRDIPFAPSLKIPQGWHYATALETESDTGGEVKFKSVPLNTLVDSPVYAGVNYKRVDLSTGPDNQVFLNIFADTPEELAMTPQELQAHRNLAVQAQKLFQSHHYKHYDFLLSLSETIGGEGLEHHQSSEDGTDEKYLTDWAAQVPEVDLLAHEYTHSWNGKFRRPAGLWTPNFNVPMQDDLLWVYEGMTQYFGYVLTARSGMRTAEQTRDLIADIAATFEDSPGRNWRPLVDTTNEETISHRHPVPWWSWQRLEDYYMEGLLIWLEADTKIRQMSGGSKSLDDFAKLFFGIDNGSFVTQTYTFEDVVHALNEVQPYDWAGFLRQRVYQVAPQTPENGITQGGYKVAYSDTPPAWLEHAERPDSPVNYGPGIGFSVDSDGTLANVWWDGPAFKAGMTPGMQITAINGTAFKKDDLKTALLAAEKSQKPISFLVKRDNRFETINVDYHGGLRYPKLERVDGTPDLLDAILAAK